MAEVTRLSSPVVPAIGIAIFGVSTHFAYWGFQLVHEIVRIATGEASHVHATSLQQLHARFDHREGGNLIVTTDFPDGDLIDFLLRSALPIVAFADDIDEMIDWTEHSRRLSPENAVRFCCNVMCVLTPAFLAPRALVIRPGPSASTLVSTIVGHLFPNSEGTFTAKIIEALKREGRLQWEVANWRLDAEPRKTDVPLTSPERRVDMKAALASYAAVFAGRFPTEIVWPVSLFTCPDAEHWRQPIDLTGPARTVMYGPYLHLPTGSWVARVEFEIDGAISGVEASTDVVISEVLVEKLFVMPSKGIFAYEIGFTVSDPRHPVEIRLFTKRSAIEGLLLIRSVVVRPG